MNPVRIGIVGLGWWACDVHIPNLLQVPDATITALCSRSAEGLARGRAALGDRAEPADFTSYDDLLASDSVDAVVLCAPNFTHGDLTLQALRAGRHVLVEKPLALDPAQCRAIAEEAESRRLVVQVGLELRYSDVAMTMRRLIDVGSVGQPILLRTLVWRRWGAPGAWRADEAKSGGLFHEMGIHYLDLFDFLARRPAAWVAAAGGTAATGRDLDYAFTTVGYEGGAVASFGMCLFAAGAGGEIPIEVVGTKGRLLGEITSGSVELWLEGGDLEDHSPGRPGGHLFGFPGSLESVRSFVHCVAMGARPLADAATGERLCRACEAARRSVAAGGEKTAI